MLQRVMNDHAAANPCAVDKPILCVRERESVCVCGRVCVCV